MGPAGAAVLADLAASADLVAAGLVASVGLAAASWAWLGTDVPMAAARTNPPAGARFHKGSPPLRSSARGGGRGARLQGHWRPRHPPACHKVPAPPARQ